MKGAPIIWSNEDWYNKVKESKESKELKKVVQEK